MALMWCMLGLNAKSAPPPEVHLFRWDMTDRHKTSPSCWQQAKLSQGWQHSNRFSPSFYFRFSPFFFFFPRECLYACAHWCHRGSLHRPPSSSPSFICLQEWGKDCHVYVWRGGGGGGGGVCTSAASTNRASWRFCPLVWFYFFGFFFFPFCLAAATSASAEGVNGAPNHSARWITPTPMDNHAVK